MPDQVIGVTHNVSPQENKTNPFAHIWSEGGGGGDDQCQIESSGATCNVPPWPSLKSLCHHHQVMMWQLTPTDPPGEQRLAAVGAGVVMLSFVVGIPSISHLWQGRFVVYLMKEMYC